MALNTTKIRMVKPSELSNKYSVEQLFNVVNKLNKRIETIESVVDEETPISQILERIEDALTDTPEYESVTITGLDPNRLIFTNADKSLVSSSSDVTSNELEQLTDGSSTSLHTHSGVGVDERVKIDAAATAGYIGAAGNDGVLRTNATLDYTDGGNYVTIGLEATLKSNYDAAYVHVSSDGKNHSDVVLNNTHRVSTGVDHSDVVLNNTHRSSDGTDHAYIDQSVTITASPTHVGGTYTGLTASRVVFTDGAKALASGASDITAAEMEELTDGSTTTLHAHAGGGITIGDAIASGTANCVLYEDSSNNIAETSGFEFDGTDTITIPAGGAYQIGASTVLETAATSTLRAGPVGNSATGNYTTLVGTDILGSQSTTSSYENTFVGSNICDNTTANLYKNVIIGYNIVSGASAELRRNIFIGENIGAALTGLSQGNVGIGNNVFQSLQSGDYNFALGKGTLSIGTSFNNCVAIGEDALKNNNSDGVIGIGRQAGQNGVGARDSIFIGYASGQNTSARRNIAIGTWSARWHSAGQNNFFGGYQVAYGSTYYNSYRNVVIGDQAFYGIGSANDDNVVIGYQAEYTGGVSNCVILGPYSGYYNATSSRLIIDNQNRSSAANEVLNSLIHGDFNATSSSQNVRLNANVQIKHDTTQSPGTKCDGHVKRAIQEVQTTDATQTTLDSITLLDENTYHAKGVVTGVKSDGSDRASYEVDVTVYRTGGGGATIQGTVTALHSQESNASWDATFTVNGNDLRLSVTGVAATTIEWGGFIQYMNMSN